MTSNSTALAKKKTKASAPRRRTGCQTCRKRRIKCDETRPSCTKCVQAGWKCDGYPSEIAVQVKLSSRSVSLQPSAKPLLSIKSYSIPFKVPGSQRDRQLLHYFCVQGSSDISGFIASDFWSRVVLQESHQDSAVRQALVAMSSLHLDYVTSDSAEGQTASVETLTHYGKAIRTIRKRLSQTTSDTTKVALVCCIIFYCCESALGGWDAALQHLSNGLELLKSYSRSASSGTDEGIEELKAVFERLDMQASFFQDDRVPLLSLPDWKEYITAVPEKGFSDAQEAHGTLVKLQSWLYSFVNRHVELHEASVELLSPHILDEKDALVQAYNRWSHAFDDLEDAKKEDGQDTHGLQVLLIHFHICQMILESKFPVDEEVFGASPNPTAHKILDLAETLLDYTTKLNSSPSATQTPRRNFSLESGVVAPLFALALKCLDESVATRAAGMLSSSHRREGLYDAQTMAQILTQLRVSRDGEPGIKEEVQSDNGIVSALEYHIPGSYEGGGIDKLLASMSI
ncbi:uncharacterized protein B0J16DRAFT_340450 [Fusarium flagelliforme]|uniref:uncharacterized protein n=1 Tax=Fusarium flagelliforme TaxID=2675880 RepID=UPI001E8E2295|nr:uncharacterized protein B0J16DRAFT_340450 [Fusarium flagelliforme]KAH7184779.1 hypothetical protein B0J16DRAFT_340450 [Fusarium flagelliforme]